MSHRIKLVYGTADPVVRLAVSVGALMCVFVAAQWILFQVGELPEDAYRSPIIVASLIRSLFSGTASGTLLLVFIAAGLAGAVHSRSFGPRWDRLDWGRELRRLAVIVAFTLSWTYSFSSYNHYFDHWYAVDRIIIIAAVAAVYWRPLLILPYLALIIPFIWQSQHPLGSFSWAEAMPLLSVPAVIWGAYVLKPVLKRIEGSDVVFVIVCVLAAHYWIPGLGKLRLPGWLMLDRIPFLLASTHANGWLGSLDVDTVSGITRTLLVVNWPMKIATITLEAGAVFCLWSKGVLRFFLACWVLLHVAVVAVSGIFFWKWMILDIALLLLFFRSARPSPRVFTKWHFLAAVLIIASAGIWSRAGSLGWYNARATYTYRVVAVDHHGDNYILPPLSFSPYHFQFTLGRFAYLSPDTSMGIVWGATMQPGLARALAGSKTPESILDLERTYGHIHYRPADAERFDNFIRVFISNLMRPGNRVSARRWFQPPPELLTDMNPPAPLSGRDIDRVHVYQITSFFDDTSYREIRTRRVRTVDF